VKRHSVSVIGVFVLAAILAACTSSGSTPSPLVTPTPTATPAPTAAPTATATATATPTAAPTATPAPPDPPTAVAMTDMTPPATCPSAYGASCYQYKVTWTEANPTGVTINVYAVTECLSKPHCVLPTTTIPAADLVLVGTANASTGAVTFIVGDGESNGDGWLNGSGGTTLFVDAVVVQAKSAAGTSSFVIAWAW